jgi:diguanylate cyclase (GGDEF)-like protein
MSVSEVAAQVMALAQDGRPEDALVLAERSLDDALVAAPSEQAALWYTISVARHIQGDNAGAHSATDRCVALAVEAGDAGWASNGLSMRAMALARQDLIEPALIDLARAEVELDACADPGLRSWAHTGLGYAYLELRLYELSAPHMVRAQELDASPIPLANAPVIDLMNLAELHLRWADELERVFPGAELAEEVLGHRAEGHAYAERALAAAVARDSPAFVATCRAIELCARPRQLAEQSLDELRRACAEEEHADYQGSRAVAGGALARTLWGLGEREEAVTVAREAVHHGRSASDWQVTASAQWLLVEMEARLGVPGASAGRAYGELLSRVLWKQRLSTLQGAQAALQVERLHRDNVRAHREAIEDPLTGVGNRRALDQALTALQAEMVARPTDGRRQEDLACSILVVDLDDFKEINDTYGHVVGDDVLRTVATAIRGVARAEDLVARLGGDEFVVLARGADAETGVRLARRIGAAVDALVGSTSGAISLHASVGVATATGEFDPSALMAQADARMYVAKARSEGDRLERELDGEGVRLPQRRG